MSADLDVAEAGRIGGQNGNNYNSWAGSRSTFTLTKQAESELLLADKIFFRTCSYPAYEWLSGLRKTGR